jgi:hypothetical protein
MDVRRAAMGYYDFYMNPNEGDPPCDPIERMAEEYHRRCDEFDVDMCGNADGIPTNGRQSRAVNQHALQVLNELLTKQRYLGLEGDLLVAIRQISRRGYGRRT